VPVQINQPQTTKPKWHARIHTRRRHINLKQSLPLSAARCKRCCVAGVISMTSNELTFMYSESGLWHVSRTDAADQKNSRGTQKLQPAITQCPIDFLTPLVPPKFCRLSEVSCCRSGFPITVGGCEGAGELIMATKMISH